jgi:hypothetical protein
MLMYSVNRELEYFDMPQVRKVVRDAKKDNYTLTSLVLGIVNTPAFRMQGPAATISKAAPATSPAKQAQAKQGTAQQSPAKQVPAKPATTAAAPRPATR